MNCGKVTEQPLERLWSRILTLTTLGLREVKFIEYQLQVTTSTSKRKVLTVGHIGEAMARMQVPLVSQQMVQDCEYGK